MRALTRIIHELPLPIRPFAQKTVWSGPQRQFKNAAQANDRAWGWGPHAAFTDDKPELRFSGPRNPVFGANGRIGQQFVNHPDYPRTR
jgi:hypothetical protein